MNISNEHVKSFPDEKQSIELFAGEWSTVLPFDNVEHLSGHADLLNDHRLDLISEKIGGFSGKRILELGPLEGAHTCKMSSEGASNILAIESNTRAFLRCLILKNLLDYGNCKFLLGDFDQYLDQSNCKFDFALACGVLYHCINPVKTIVNLTKVADSIGFWSHYFEKDIARKLYGDRFDFSGKILEHEGVKGVCYTQQYREALNNKGFCGGMNSYTRWMDFSSWQDVLAQVGFDFEILAHSTNHPNGPEFTAIAKRRS